MDRVRGEEACEREEVMCKHGHERGVRSAHFGHGLFLFGCEFPFPCSCLIWFGFKCFCLVVGLRRRVGKRNSEFGYVCV